MNKGNTKIVTKIVLMIISFRVLLYGGTTPQKIIDEYVEKERFKSPGNVLAYYNSVGQIIVLKSGISFAEREEEVEKDEGVLVLSLNEVLRLATTGIGAHFDGKKIVMELSSRSPSEKEIEKYCNLIENHQKGQQEWENVIKKLGYVNRSIKEKSKISSFFKNIKDNTTETVLMTRLAQIRHSEFQIAALYQAWLEGTISKTDPRKNMLRYLLPTCLFSQKLEYDKNIYSLFEACNSCTHVKWLENNKKCFRFKVLDGQIPYKVRRYLGKDYIKRDGTISDKTVLERFMSQEALIKKMSSGKKTSESKPRAFKEEFTGEERSEPESSSDEG